jgi:hypothetical protein
MKPTYCCALAVLALVSLSCSGKPENSAHPYKMGERLQLRSLSYTVLDANWRTHLGDPGSGRTPQNRFLIVRLSVTNGGGSEVLLPALTVEDPKGNTFPESSSGEHVENWVGPLRCVKPGQTLEGRFLFDVPFGPVKLRITDDVDDTEQPEVAYVELPIEFDRSAPVVDAGRAGGQPAVLETGPARLPDRLPERK